MPFEWVRESRAGEEQKQTQNLGGGEAWPVALGPRVGQWDAGRMRVKGLPQSCPQALCSSRIVVLEVPASQGYSFEANMTSLSRVLI